MKLVDIGYRFIEEFWGLGIATEVCIAFLKYGFHELGLEIVYALDKPENMASNKILTKMGLKIIKYEEYDDGGDLCNWYKLERIEYLDI